MQTTTTTASRDYKKVLPGEENKYIGYRKENLMKEVETKLDQYNKNEETAV